jgi:hypothetical protein
MATSPTSRTERAEPRIDPDLDPETGATLTSGDRGDSIRTPAPRRSPIVWLVLLMVLAAGAVFFYLWRQDTSQQPALAPPSTQPPAAAEAAPTIRHPIEDAQGAAANPEAKPLPALMVSDTTMQNTLADLFGPASLGKVFYEDAIIHRFVTTVDNLPRKTVPSRNLPVKPIAGPLVTSAKDDNNVSISADNATRYRPYVQMAESIDAKNLVSAYVHFYPLIQQDYRDLGYPKGYFNDRLIEAIDDLLAAPELTEPLQVVQPKVLYQYADPELEARSAGQKIMIRMGNENAAKIKAKLRDIRRELTGPEGTPGSKQAK